MAISNAAVSQGRKRIFTLFPRRKKKSVQMEIILIHRPKKIEILLLCIVFTCENCEDFRLIKTRHFPSVAVKAASTHPICLTIWNFIWAKYCPSMKLNIWAKYFPKLFAP